MTRRRRQTTKGTTAKNRTGAARTTPHCGVFEKRIKSRRCQPVGNRAGNLGLQCPRPGTPGLGITMRVRTHGFSRRIPFSRWRKSQEAALTAPEGAGGSKLLLLDERCDSSVELRNSVQLIGLEAVASPRAHRAVSVLLPAPQVATLLDARGLACVKTEQGLQTLKASSCAGLGWVAT